MVEGNVHVVFGSGPLGKSTARALLSMGHKVRMINRSGKVEPAVEGAEVVASDAYDAEQNIANTRDAAAIYQCAQPHYHEWVEKFLPLQRAIQQAAEKNGARFIVAENLYMYQPFTGALREDAPLGPITRKGKVRARMAEEVLEAHASGRLNAAIGRASDFFGPEDFALTSFAILPAVKGKAVNLLGNADMPHTFTYIPDFGRLLATLGTRPEGLGQVWFAPSNPAITQNQFADLIAVELGRPVKRLVGGKWMLGLLGLFQKEIKETYEMLYEWEKPFVVDTSKAQNTFGLQPTPLKEALKTTLDWCKSLP